MNKAYSRINWQNQPSTSTALGATNLNKMDIALNSIDDRVITLDTTKLDLTTANSMVKSFSLDQSTGVITITLLDGTVTTYDTKLEKLAVNFAYDATAQQLVITLDDGTKQYVDMSALITQYEFKDSSTVGFTVDASGKVSASVKNGSITAEQLQPNYLADITTQQQTATAQAKLAKRYAVGGVETGDTTDNAKYYKEQAELFKTQAKQYRDEAQDISGVGIAGESKLGLVKGDGNVGIESDGDMWADPYKDKGTVTGTFINFKNSDDALAQINAKGITTATPTNPDLPISPDNKLNLSSPLNFDLVSCGINLFDSRNAVASYNQKGITIINNNGKLIINGTSTEIIDLYIVTIGATNFNTKANELIKTVKNAKKPVTLSNNLSLKNYFYDGTSYITNTMSNTENIRVAFLRIESGKTFSNEELKIQLELSSVATPHADYKEDRINIPYPMRSNPDGTADLIRNNQHERWTDLITITGTETWGYNYDGGEYARFSLYDINFNKIVNGRLSTHFKPYLLTNSTEIGLSENVHGATTDGRIGITIKTSRLPGWSSSLTTTEKQNLFKAWLKGQFDNGTPVIVQVGLINSINNSLNTYLKTFNGTTNIFTTANPQPEITATFKSQLWADSYLKEKAIESKFDTNKVLNNDTATIPGFAWDAVRGAAARKDIDAINSKISFENVSYTPSNTGKSTLREYLISLLSNTSKITGIFTCSAFTDLPRTDWGYTVEFVRSGTVFVKIYMHLSSAKNYFIREIGSDNQWMGDWIPLTNDFSTDWISGVDIKSLMTSNLGKVKFHLFSTGCTNGPSGWNWFAVIQMHTRAFAFSPLEARTKIAFSSYESNGWTDWQIPEENNLVSASVVIVPNNVTEYDITNLNGLSDSSGAIATNGDLAANNVQIIGVKVVNSNTLRVYFATPANGALRVNILYKRT